MRRALAVLVLVLAAAALSPSPAAAGVSLRAVELVGDARRAPAAGTEVGRFTLAGIHWRGRGRVVFRTRSTDGRWSRWRPAAPEAHDVPDAGSREAARSGSWRVGNPWWVGPSTAIEARTSGRVGRVRAHLVWSPELRVPLRAPAAAQQPAIVPRATWRANESIRRAPPVYAPAVRFAVVHHTAGRNAYSPPEAAAIVRGIQLYHVRANGWNDIGYNFLVDRFGTIYEGRYGGIDKNVVGAHARGFNTGSVGIAVLGTYGEAAPAQAALDAVARLVAWRLDLSHVDPSGRLTLASAGSERFAPGVPVPLRAVSGHRDTGLTECPGDALYAQLGRIAADARRIGLPKIFAPAVAEDDAGVRFTARLSSSLPWSVVVTTASGSEVGRGSGTGALVDWSWDAAAVPPGRYRWTLSAGSARPARGTITAGGAAALAVLEAATTPSAITPNADGQADSAAISFRLTAPANVTVQVVDAAGAVLATPVDRVWARAGPVSATVDGTLLPDGRYDVVVDARREDGAQATVAVPLLVSRNLGTVAATPTPFSPNGDGRKDRVELTFSVAAPVEARVRVFREGRGVASLLAAPVPAGTQRLSWTGVRQSGPVRDGEYTALVEVLDPSGWVGFGVPIVVDTTAPRVRFLPGRQLRIAVSEPVGLRVRLGSRVVRREVAKAGVVRIPWRGAVPAVRAVAVDLAGNESAPALRPARPGRARPGQ